MKKSVIALLAFVTIVTVSCKKDTEETQAVTKESISGAYKMESYKMQINGGAETDETASNFEPCELDDVLTLKTDFTYVSTDAGTQCSSSQNESGVWSLPSTTSFILEGETFTIKSWNGKQLVLTQTESSGGLTVTNITRLNKQ